MNDVKRVLWNEVLLKFHQFFHCAYPYYFQMKLNLNMICGSVVLLINIETSIVRQ